MKKMKRSVVACIVLISVFALFACGGNGSATQGENNQYDSSTFSIEEIQDNPSYYVGRITLIGVTGNSATQDFALQNEAGTFEVLVDYRGSQALPEIGNKVSVEGQFRENRPCCGPGFTITSTQFEVIE
jgi:ABC-type oligopeptide transport system substrate-binding subunit